MVEQQLRSRDIEDERVLEAMERVPRELFVPEQIRRRAYDDAALPIGFGQTISQPYMVARICEALSLHGSERVLDVGTGSGYQAAVLAELAHEVHTIERIPELAAFARERLAQAGYAERVHVHVGAAADRAEPGGARRRTVDPLPLRPARGRGGLLGLTSAPAGTMPEAWTGARSRNCCGCRSGFGASSSPGRSISCWIASGGEGSGSK